MCAFALRVLEKPTCFSSETFLLFNISYSTQFSRNGCSWIQFDSLFKIYMWWKSQSSVAVPAVRSQKDGLQTWQWRAGVMDSTRSLIKILIETIRQWQIRSNLDPSWHEQGEPVKTPRPWRAPGCLEEPTWLACSSFHSFVISKDAASLLLLHSSSRTRFRITPSHQTSHLA